MVGQGQDRQMHGIEIAVLAWKTVATVHFEGRGAEMSKGRNGISCDVGKAGTGMSETLFPSRTLGAAVLALSV